MKTFRSASTCEFWSAPSLVRPKGPEDGALEVMPHRDAHRRVRLRLEGVSGSSSKIQQQGQQKKREGESEGEREIKKLEGEGREEEFGAEKAAAKGGAGEGARALGSVGA